MKYLLKIFAGIEDGKSVAERHSKIIDVLINLDEDFKISSDLEYPAPSLGNDISAIFEIKRKISKNFKGHILYIYRINRINEDFMNEDFIYLEFNPSKISLSSLVYEVLPKLIKGFDAICAFIHDLELIYEDFDLSRNKSVRKDIFRFYPIHFIDENISKNALKLSLKEVERRLQGAVEAIVRIGTGILIVSSSSIMSIEEIKENYLRLRKLLRL